MKIARLVVACSLVSLPLAQAQPVCPKLVADSILRSFPSAAITSCASATFDGFAEYRVDITAPDHPSRELDVAPDGKILAISEEVAASAVPDSVLHAFRTKHRGAKLLRIERTQTDAAVTYELVYSSGGRLAHATVKAPARRARSR